MQSAYYVKKLKEDFSRRTRANPAFSLRAYGRYLGVHPSTLSQVLLGRRPLPGKSAERVLEKLRLNTQERARFKQSLRKKKLTIDSIAVMPGEDRFLLDEAYFQIIAEWEHYAVLTLFDCKKFDGSIPSIVQRLNVSARRAEVVLENLLRYGLVNKDERGALSKAHPRVRTTEDVASRALMESHFDTLELGKKKLEEVPVELRDFSSAMFAVDRSKLPQAKMVIREFRQKMAALLSEGEKNSVFQLAIQFYPITNPIGGAS